MLSKRECNGLPLSEGSSYRGIFFPNPQQTTFDVGRGMSASVLKEKSGLHSTEYTTVQSLCLWDLLLHVVSLHLGKTPPRFWLVSFAGKFMKEYQWNELQPLHPWQLVLHPQLIISHLYYLHALYPTHLRPSAGTSAGLSHITGGGPQLIIPQASEPRAPFILH